MFCPRCGKENDDMAKYCQACGNGLQSSITPSGATGVARYAAFWERLVAQVIDAVILSVATGTVFTATFGAGMAIVFTDLNGNLISFARATGRHFAKYISVFLLGIGFIIAAFTAKKQALH